MSGFEQFIQERLYLQNENVSPRTVEWYHQTFKWLERYLLTEQGLKDLVIGMRPAGLEEPVRAIRHFRRCTPATAGCPAR